MATTSFLYHSLGLRGYHLLRTEYREGKVIYHIEMVSHKRTCKECEAPWHSLKLDGCFERTFLALPVGKRRQELVLHGHLQLCDLCKKRVREPIDFADGSSRYIKAFGRYAVMLCGISTIKSVASLLGVGWDLVKDLFKGHLERRHRKRTLQEVRYIAVDEFSIHKGHKYMTVVLDLEVGDILHAQEGKGASSLIPFLEKLKHARAPLKAVAVDMSEAYASAVRQVFGDNVDVVHDPFHVVALASEAIDETRRDLARELEGEDRKVIKGSRFLLLSGLENLKESGMTRLMKLMVANEPLYQAYLLKEDLRMFWNPLRPSAQTPAFGWVPILRTQRPEKPFWISGSPRPEAWRTSTSPSSLKPWTPTGPDFWPTSATASRPVHWKVSTIRSRSSSDKPTASAIWPSSN